MSRLPIILIAALLAHLTTLATPAQAGANDGVRTDTPSGLPVPRFVSLKGSKTYCRMGPSFDYPVTVTYMRQGTPVEIVAETTDHWRKIRDQDGTECWAHQATLRALTHIVALSETDLLARPEEGAPVRARLAEGVLAKLIRSEGPWRFVSAGGVKGWARADAFWGAK